MADREFSLMVKYNFINFKRCFKNTLLMTNCFFFFLLLLLFCCFFWGGEGCFVFVGFFFCFFLFCFFCFVFFLGGGVHSFFIYIIKGNFDFFVPYLFLNQSTYSNEVYSFMICQVHCVSR